MEENYTQPARKLVARTPLDKRMQMQQPGQATWPEPLLNETCGRCFFFDRHATTRRQIASGKGRCRRAAQVMGHWATQIKARYVACSEFGVKGGE